MNSNPKISIIVPVYNVEKYLRPCLDSIKAQIYTDFETVLVDDGSIDQSGEICDNYAAEDSRFVVIHKQNEGVTMARITAFEHSHGDYITFIDADDYVSPEYLEKLVKPIIEEDADMVSCDHVEIKSKSKKIRKPIAKLCGVWEKDEIQEFIANHYFYDKKTKGYGMTVFLCTKMIKRELVMDGLKEGIGMWYGEDQIAVYHILQQCKKLVLIPDRLYYYVQNEIQVKNIYNYSLWGNIVILMEKYKIHDKDNLYKNGRRIRTWLHIHNTTRKMIRVNLPKNEFCNHLSLLRSYPIMKEFFLPLSIGLHFEGNIKYWLLKLRFFKAYYYLLLLKNRSRKAIKRIIY